MREYQYEIVDRSGRVVKGVAEAASVSDLVRELSAEGHTVVEVAEPRATRPSLLRRRLGANHTLSFQDRPRER